MKSRNGADILIEALIANGVDTIFGLPGVQIMPIFDALAKTPEIRLITVRHEQAAAYMADGYARSSGKPGVALVVPGPGALNATAAIGTAYSASSPVLLISGQIWLKDIGRHHGALHQINDQLDVFKPITKWAERITKVQDIPEVVARAFRELLTGRPRPVEIELPPDVLADDSDVVIQTAQLDGTGFPEEAVFAEALLALCNAKKILILAGDGAQSGDSSQQLRGLAELLHAPVITTPEGKGVIPEDHPLALGAAYYGFGVARALIPKADLIVTVGARANRDMSGIPELGAGQLSVQIDVDPTEVQLTSPTATALIGDVAQILRELTSRLRGSRLSTTGWELAELDDARNWSDWNISKVTTYQKSVIDTLRDVLPRDSIVIAGVTNPAYWAHLTFPSYASGTYLTSAYFATLGFAFPTALGAKVANPDSPVVALTGDGGFLYNLSELATAAQHGINIVIVLFNDGAFGASLNDQQTQYQGRVLGTEIRNPDFMALAKAFGIVGMRTNLEEFGETLRYALTIKSTVLLELPIQTAVPPFQASA